MNLSRTVPRTVVIGADAFIGRKFLQVYRETDPDAPGTSRRSGAPFFLDLAGEVFLPVFPESVREAVIVAAEPNVARCEANPAESYQVNVKGTLAVVSELVRRKIKPIFFSTDYVFDGTSGAYDDDAPLMPGTAYGRHKVEVERRLPELCGENYLVIRPGKVFDLVRGSGTIFDEMAANLAAGKEVRAAFDQIFAPVFIDDLVRAVLLLQMQGATGVFNVCMPEYASRLEMAVRLARFMNVDPGLVRSIELDSISSGFQRPKRTDMVCRRLSGILDFQMMGLDEALRNVARNYA